MPAVPLGVPSLLLQRRPDIAAAERDVAAANAQIGIQRSAYFPSLSLSGSLGAAGARVADLFSASGTLWSLGVSVAQTLFDAGAIARPCRRRRGGSRRRDRALSADRADGVPGVEDQLATTRVLVEQEALRREASAAADATEAQILNRYRAGQLNYTEVVTAQVSALNARRALLQLALSPAVERGVADPGARRRLARDGLATELKYRNTLGSGRSGLRQNSPFPGGRFDGKDLVEAVPRRRAGDDRRRTVHVARRTAR